MSVEPHADEELARRLDAGTADGADDGLGRRRPNVSGDLPGLFQTAPMFRRAVAGYDRFQVDTYVQWAEEELATADSEREHLVARLLDTRAALGEARQLLSHSSGGGEFLQTSRRVGNMLAAAADEAECIRAEADRLRAEADAERRAATRQAEEILARADRARTDAVATADRLVARARTEAEEMAAAASRLVDEAEATHRQAQAEADARLEAVRLAEERAAEEAAQLRLDAEAEASAARVRARSEIVGMLHTAREERRRADAAAAAVRERLDREAAARRSSLLADVPELEQRREQLQAEVDLLAGALPRSAGGRLTAAPRRVLDRLLDRSGQTSRYSRAH